MEDRRHFPRTKCFKGATIKAPGQAVACIVRNVSAEGAGLQDGGRCVMITPVDQ